MREMHVLGVSDDGEYVVLATRADANRGSVQVAIDDRLREAVRGRLAAPQQGPAQSRLTPRDIQARLRAGESAAQVARVAGVPVSRVEPYAGPVLAERSRVVGEAQAATMVRPRQGGSTVPLGEAAEAHLVTTPFLRPESVDWSAHRTSDGSWTVVLTFLAGGKRTTAEWRWDPADRALRPLDRAASSLGFVGPPGSEPEPVDQQQPSSSERTVRRTAGKARPAPRTPATGFAARTDGASSSPGEDAPAVEEPATSLPAASDADGKGSEATGNSTAPAPSALPNRASNGRRQRKGRPTVPSWSDVLLGVQDPSERREAADG